MPNRELIRTFFPQQPHFACLLLQPLSMTKSAAGFQFCGGGDPTPVPVYVPFPFDAAQMKQEPVESHAAAPVRKKEPPTRSGPAAKPAYRSRFLLPILLFILAATASAGMYGLWKAPRAARWAQIHLDARLSARELLLSWDAASPAAVHATRGILAVTDGPTPFEIPLTTEQIRRGSFSYSPSHADVWLQLRLYDKDNSLAADSLRVIRPAHQPAVVSDLPAGLPASPAAILHEVEPAISAGLRARIQAPMVVPVLVNVDASGHVTQAWSKVTGHGLDRYLADAAVKAARRWTFVPARSQDGSPAAAMKTISFEFTPGGE